MAFSNELNTDEAFVSMEVATATHQSSNSITRKPRTSPRISSPTLTVAGHNCKFRYYPRVEEPNWIGLALVLYCKSKVTALGWLVGQTRQARPEQHGGI